MASVKKTPPPQKGTKESPPASHGLMLVTFGVIAAFFSIALVFWTLIPYFQMTTYLGNVTKGRIQAIHKSDFVFSPYTYAQRMIRYEYLKFLEEQKIDKTTLYLFDDAIQKMEELVVIEGTNPYQHIRLGRAFEKKVDILQDHSYFAKADEYYRKAIELAPQRQETYYAYGLSLVRQNRLKEAVQMLSAPPALDPDIPISYFYLGLAHFNLGKETYIDVLKNLEFSFQRIPENPDINVSRNIYEKLLYHFYTQGDAQRMMTVSERLAQISPDQQPLYGQVIAWMKKNNNQVPSLQFQGGKLSTFMENRS